MKEAKSCAAGVVCTACSQSLYDVVERPSKISVTPENVVTTDPVVVEQEPSRETRRRLEERKTDPDGLDDKDAEDGAAPDDPASIRSWLPCLDMCDG
jgi:hypothetical protein